MAPLAVSDEGIGSYVEVLCGERNNFNSKSPRAAWELTLE
jgi:hypothetical protein